MRPDIKKVICERERRGDRSFTGGKKHYEADYEYRRNTEERDDEYANLDCLPSKEGMMRRLGWETRNFSENLGAVRGMVIKNVGKNWDKIYSQLCQLCPPNGTNIERHVHQHIDDYILRETKWLNSTVHVEQKNNHFSTESWIPIKDFVNQRKSYRYYFSIPNDGNFVYFVHPKTRCIAKMRMPKQVTIVPELTFFRTPKQMFGKFDGLWFELLYEKARYATRKVLNWIGNEVVETFLVQTDIAIDVCKHTLRYPEMSYRRGKIRSISINPNARESLYGKDVVVTKRRQLSAKEMRQLGLKND